MKRYRIKEIFGPTLQGEGSMSGTPCFFVRFAGCNRWSGRVEDKASAVCKFCDTDFFGGRRMTSDEILAALKALSPQVKWVVLSGGEPTIQIDDPLLMLLSSQYQLMLETNGSNAIGDLYLHFDHVTMSPKQSRAETKLERCDDLKILFPYISDEITLAKFMDFEYHERFLQPIDPLPDPTADRSMGIEGHEKATIEECIRTRTRLSLQIHKILGVK